MSLSLLFWWEKPNKNHFPNTKNKQKQPTKQTNMVCPITKIAHSLEPTSALVSSYCYDKTPWQRQLMKKEIWGLTALDD